MPSSTAAKVAFLASSIRSLRSSNSVSVAAPTLMTATPPATRRCVQKSFGYRTRNPSASSFELSHTEIDVFLGRPQRSWWWWFVRWSPYARSQGVVEDAETEILGDVLRARYDGDVLQQRLTTFTEARRLDGGDLEHTADLVHHQGGGASPTMSSAMIKSGRTAWFNSSKRGPTFALAQSFRQ